MNRRGSAWEREAARAGIEVTRRAIRRLDILEWVILALAMGLAVAGGALVAWVLVGTEGPSFRWVWLVVSAVLVVVPGVIVFMGSRNDERSGAAGSPERPKGEDG